MLPAFIIEHLRERERRERRSEVQPSLELELPIPVLPSEADSTEDPQGVIIIQL